MSCASRLAYHGVPKILKTNERSWDILDETEISNGTTEEIEICRNEEKWKTFGSYLEHCRINMNVRQVLNRGSGNNK